jgi:predicted N-acetyltransferase YhbS
LYAVAYKQNRDLGFPASAETATASEIAEWIERDKMWVAEVDGRVAGSVRLRADVPGCPTLCRLAVAPAMAQTGIGSLLISTAEAAARASGSEAIRLTVALGHPFLSAMYMRRGYTVTGPKVPPNPRYAEIEMLKRLLGPALASARLARAATAGRHSG